MTNTVKQTNRVKEKESERKSTTECRDINSAYKQKY